jgi:hypothetical protein
MGVKYLCINVDCSYCIIKRKVEVMSNKYVYMDCNNSFFCIVDL